MTWPDHCPNQWPGWAKQHVCANSLLVATVFSELKFTWIVQCELKWRRRQSGKRQKKNLLGWLWRRWSMPVLIFAFSFAGVFLLVCVSFASSFIFCRPSSWVEGTKTMVISVLSGLWFCVVLLFLLVFFSCSPLDFYLCFLPPGFSQFSLRPLVHSLF
jgi:hypothetical protein